ncbi:hypothetical protein E8E14_001375 [Neopestalotiopsis sp. 37M]|nr:hypothetical protein E8E14_001375 [Neopestalotiopsis sp. 37M]
MLATLIAPVLGAVALWWVFRPWIQQAAFSPLAKLPTVHWSCAWSPLWVLYLRYSGRELEVMHEAHQKLGPVLRVGPRDVSVSCYNDGVRTIYGGGMDKPDYYDYYQYHDVENSFATLLRGEHATRRRRVAGVYTKSFVQNSPHLAVLSQKIIDGRLLPLMADLAKKGETFCMLRLTWALSFDLITSFIFGLEAGSNFLADVSKIDKITDAYDARYPHETFWKKETPGLHKMLAACGLSPLGARNTKYQNAKKFLEAFTLNFCHRADAVLKRGKKVTKESGNYPMVFAAMRIAVDKEYPHLSEKAKMTIIASEMFDHLSSAHEVFGLVQAYTLRFVAQNSGAQSRLRDEFLGNAADQAFSPQSASTLGGLPYLSAVINESFRLRPTGTPLPRVTPKNKTTRLGRYEGIPGGVRVNTYQWFLHRDPRIWNAAEEWVPERWLKDGENAGPGKDQVLWQFCSGPRMCVGNHLTDYLMRQIMSSMMTNFELRNQYTEALDREDIGTAKDRIPMVIKALS